jgi:hypothetical protein
MFRINRNGVRFWVIMLLVCLLVGGSLLALSFRRACRIAGMSAGDAYLVAEGLSFDNWTARTKWIPQWKFVRVYSNSLEKVSYVSLTTRSYTEQL